jgi:predicted metalloprotease
MRSNANPTLTQMRENGEITDDSSASSSASTSSGGGLSSVQSGAIGAMVSLVVVLVLLFGFQLLGWLTVGKKQIAARRQQNEENQNQVSCHLVIPKV